MYAYNTFVFPQHHACGIYVYSPEFLWRRGTMVYFCFVSVLMFSLLVILVLPVKKFIHVLQKYNPWTWSSCLLSCRYLSKDTKYMSPFLLRGHCTGGYNLLNIKDLQVFLHVVLLRIVKSKSWNDLSNVLILCIRELRGRELK